MDAQPFDRVSRALSTWLSRRKVLRGIGATIAGGALAWRQTEPSGEVPQEPAADPGTETNDVQRTSDQPLQNDTPVDQPPPDEPPTVDETPYEPPVLEETPYETPVAEETPDETTTVEETPAETPEATEATEETLPARQEPEAPRDETRVRIAEICREAAEVLKQDVDDPAAFDQHPHPGEAYGFLNMLNGIAEWGTQAETWDDNMLARYVDATEVIALAIRVGADAYFELYREEFPDEDFPDDPDTCIFRELAKWRDSNDTCDADDPVCRMTSFWNFTVLNSCRRCLRAF